MKFVENNLKKLNIITLLLLILLAMGFLVRMIDLKDPPLDFHPTRQLRGAIIARRIYLSINPQADPENYAFATNPDLYDFVARREPPITESVVSFFYVLIGNEILWVSRIVTSIFWCFGAVGLFLLVKKFTNSKSGLLAAIFYLFNPFGVIVSRSFQPESLMVASIIWSLYFFVRWQENQTWKSAIILALTTSFAILVKPNALFLLAPVFIASILAIDGLKKSIRTPQLWVMGLIIIVFPLYYYSFINPGAGGFLDNWFTVFISNLTAKRFYLGWGSIITDVVPFSVLIIALLSTLLYERKPRLIALGLWLGYLLLGLFVPYHIHTHDYYSIVLVPIASFSMGKIIYVVVEYTETKKKIVKFGMMLLIVLSILYSTWSVYKTLMEKSYRGEPQGWRQIGEVIPEDYDVIALTHNYGGNVAYYSYIMPRLWPYTFDQNIDPQNFEDYFQQMTDGQDLFLVTHFGELNSQPLLMEKLSELEIFYEDPGFILYDLSSPR
jgi:4-amino-4-deoxy-L-arabinose transferase-like glycosyltransferase